MIAVVGRESKGRGGRSGRLLSISAESVCTVLKKNRVAKKRAS